MLEYLVEKLLLTISLKSFSVWPSSEVLTSNRNYFLYLKCSSDHHCLLSLFSLGEPYILKRRETLHLRVQRFYIRHHEVKSGTTAP